MLPAGAAPCLLHGALGRATWALLCSRPQRGGLVLTCPHCWHSAPLVSVTSCIVLGVVRCWAHAPVYCKGHAQVMHQDCSSPAM